MHALVRSVDSNSSNPNAFETVKRMIKVNDHLAETGTYLIGTSLHECLGHATDPTQLHLIKLPKIDLLQILEGYYQAVSQAFSVENEFFNHPGDTNIPALALRLGEQVGQLFTSQKISITHHNLPKTHLTLNSQANYFFNKRHCEAIGREVIDQINHHQTLPSRELLEIYRQEIENGLVEIYAEMVRLCLEPDQADVPNNNLEKVRANPDIITGINKVLEVVSYPRNLNIVQLRAMIRQLKTDYFSSNNQQRLEEDQARTQLNTMSKQEIISKGSKIAKAELAYQTSVYKDYQVQNLLMFEGQLPPMLKDMDSKAYQIVYEYVRYLSFVFKKSEFNLIALDPKKFDHPSMHIWHIRSLVHLCNPDRLRDLAEILTGDFSKLPTPDIQAVNQYARSFTEYTQGLKNFIFGQGEFSIYHFFPDIEANPQILDDWIQNNPHTRQSDITKSSSGL